MDISNAILECKIDTTGLRVLDLSNKNINAFGGIIFWPELEELILDNNAITVRDEQDVIAINESNIKKLSMRNNGITDSFYISDLTTPNMDFSFNKITDFDVIKAAKNINLSHNKLVSLSTKAVVDYLDVQYNDLASIDGIYATNLSADFNKIMSIENYVAPAQLIRLSLSNNMIKTIGTIDTNNMQSCDISKNPYSTITQLSIKKRMRNFKTSTNLIEINRIEMEGGCTISHM